jgi:hypothetical protein
MRQQLVLDARFLQDARDILLGHFASFPDVILELRGCSGLASSPSRAAERLGSPMSGNRREDELDRRFRICSPGAVNGERPRSGSCPQPVSDDRAFEHERRRRTALVARPRSFREERAMRDADRRQVELGAEVEGEAGSPRVIPSGCVDEEDVRRPLEPVDCRLQRRPLAEGEQAGLVRRARLPLGDGPGVCSCGGGPERIARSPRAALSAQGADKAAADNPVGLGPEGRCIRLRERTLSFHQLVGRGRPGRHEVRIIG